MAGDVGYTVPAEFVYPKYFHKKGALSAARQGDNVISVFLLSRFAGRQAAHQYG